jgi:hypothetical protein
MKKWERWIVYPILAISISFSLAVICKWLPRILNINESGQYDLGFDYMGVIVGILSLLVTVLIGWNIYQLVDFKGKLKQINLLSEKQEKEINYIHNKADYNQAINYAIISQTLSAHFAPNEDSSIKFQMLIKGLTSLKILSNFPDYEKEISSLTETIIKGLNNSSSVRLDEKTKTNLLLMCGEINNKNKISKYETIIELIKRS